MKLASVLPESKHPFEKSLDSEQTFVVRCSHDEHRFDAAAHGGRFGGTVASTDAGGHARAEAGAIGSGARGSADPRVDIMTVAWTAPSPRAGGPLPGQRGAGLRLVGEDEGVLPRYGRDGGQEGAVAQPSRRRTSMAVRRRRTLLAATALLLVGLALPLSGTGGHSHPTGSAPAETGGAVSYTVQPGDSLWSIVERISPTSDPRPLVAQMASQLGSATVVPGERITVP
jgi:hypothetical protein